MSAKCYLSKRKLVWEILFPDSIYKKQLLIEWNSIDSMESIPELFQLKVSLQKLSIFSTLIFHDMFLPTDTQNVPLAETEGTAILQVGEHY